MPPSLSVVAPINPGSDGDQTKWPGPNSSIKGIRAIDDLRFRTTLGNKWTELKGEAAVGSSYTLDKFPSGYKLFGRTRENSTHTDAYVYGHPSGYAFRSTNEFFDHFVNLMNSGGRPQNCQCKGCNHKSYNRPSIGNNHASTGSNHASITTSISDLKPRGRAKKIKLDEPDEVGATTQLLPPPPIFHAPVDDRAEMVDEEGTPDVYRRLAEELREKGSLDMPINEKESIDWCIESESLPNHIRKLQQQPRFIPRSGELVLFFRKLEAGQNLLFDEKSNIFRLWDETTKSWTSPPIWEAGMITEASAEQVTVKDLVIELGKAHQVNYSGFRVEPLPEIGNARKPWSKRSIYVPLHQIRPFCFWQEYLRGAEPSNYHATVKHCLGASSSFSTLHRYHFKGTYPDATIFCKGVFIGPELVLVGDTVRLTPQQNGQQRDRPVMEILRITAIKLKILNIGDLESRFGEEDTKPPPWYTCLHVSGIAFTTDASTACSKTPIDPKTSKTLPSSVDGYGTWYHMHGSEQRMELPFQRILGRCFEDEAMMLWFPSKLNSRQSSPVVAFNAINKGKGKAVVRPDVEADLSIGLRGMLEARRSASESDGRISHREGKTWFWGNDRVDQLDLHEIKNVDVGVHSTFGGEVSTSLRQSKHLDAMRRAKKSRERGYKGPGGKALSGKEAETIGQRFQPSSLVAGGMNAVQAAADEEGSEQESSDVDMDVDVVDAKRGQSFSTFRDLNIGGQAMEVDDQVPFHGKRHRTVIELDDRAGTTKCTK